ncbi:snare associated Golgi protein [Glomus cerebriforme]|uniref:Snare associated Golgi protein n=1 Tax=Glomus cerebriforme TaxID=658196 RepID=A0A397T993_9GLOM|nr:snare associated Golgi protein [Glomus cerebriforme]
MSTKSKTSIITSIIFLLIIFILSTEIIYFILSTYLSNEAKNVLKFPRNLKDIRILHDVLTSNRNDDIQIVICYVATYIFLQSFSIPGSVMLSVLGGTLWGSWNALILISFCSGTGATVCYLLSYYLGKPIIQTYLSEHMKNWNERLNSHREGLFSYIIFLRIAPILPNWFINIASPHLGVGIGVFYWATFFGVAPLTFIHVQAGETIHKLSENDEFVFLTTQNIITMSLVAIVALIPIILRKRFESQEKNKLIDSKKNE